ncbi:hypothetical protein [Halonatronum saccharophilum]|uniref:hypothetical protein n=1 Tax=Halonatronum saccharophilum TaxID=150060 RepID=UPI0004AD7745|nr:hypothetical protein [Halonatronum saccharophilum]
MEECVLEDKGCRECGECLICDLDKKKRCDNCMECLDMDTGFKAIRIDGVDYDTE